MTTQLPTLADKLRAYRKHSALKLHQVAAKTGLSISHISEIENGTNNPSLETCQKLATLYGLTLAALFEGVTIQERK